MATGRQLLLRQRRNNDAGGVGRTSQTPPLAYAARCDQTLAAGCPCCAATAPRQQATGRSL